MTDLTQTDDTEMGFFNEMLDNGLRWTRCELCDTDSYHDADISNDDAEASHAHSPGCEWTQT